MENPWPGTAPPPQGIHSNVPYQTPKSEYESEYESDDTEIPKSEYESEYESDTKIPKSEYESEYESDDTETPTDKGIVNLEIEDLRKDSQVLEKGKGKVHTLPHHHLHP